MKHGETGTRHADPDRSRSAAPRLPATTEVSAALATAAQAALRAPSVHNTQPWHWRVGVERLELRADQRRQLTVADPDGRLLLVSCGAALHHARVALRAMGHLPSVRRLPDQRRPDLLAEVTVAKPIPITDDAVALAQATTSRRSERGAFPYDVPAPAIAALRRAAASEGVWLHMLRPEQTRAFLGAAERADNIQYGDPEYRRELASWTAGADTTAGVPATSVPPRGNGYHTTGSYGLLYGSGDRPVHWLRAGEALSAVWLTAITHGLVAQPLSSAIEVPAGRAALHQLLSGIGNPYLALRIGAPETGVAASATPRRPAREAIEVESPAGTASQNEDPRP